MSISFITFYYLTFASISMLFVSGLKSNEEANRHEFPWVVSLVINFTDGFTNVCGASFIDKEWLLSSASCMKYRGELSAESVTAILGRYDLGLSSENGQEKQIISSKSVFIHPKYDSTMSYDFALIHLNTAVRQSRSIAVVDLPDSFCKQAYTSRSSEVDSCTSAIAFGWGMQKPRQPYSDWQRTVLHKTHLSILPYLRNCSWAGSFNNASICTGTHDSKVSCLGDPGAALACHSKAYGQMYILGVASLTTCGENIDRRFGEENGHWQRTGVYARICSALPWIRGFIPMATLSGYEPDYGLESRGFLTRRLPTTREPEPTTTFIDFDTFCKTGIPRIPHARVFMSPPLIPGLPVVDGNMWFPVGFTLHVHCGQGYHLHDGHSNKITCLQNGQWSHVSCSLP